MAALERNLKTLSQNKKWIAYQEVLDFLKWNFTEEFALKEIKGFHVVEGKIYENKRNRKR